MYYFIVSCSLLVCSCNRWHCFLRFICARDVLFSLCCATFISIPCEYSSSNKILLEKSKLLVLSLPLYLYYNSLLCTCVLYFSNDRLLYYAPAWNLYSWVLKINRINQINQSLDLYVCLPVFLLSLSLSVSLSLSLSLSVFVSVCVCLSLCLSICLLCLLSIFLSICIH